VQTEFSRRLTQAANESRKVPPLNHGRAVFIAKECGVSQEAVRKWFSGESTPKNDKLKELAELLEVDEAWLAFGKKPELDRKELRQHATATDGGVYLLYGMAQLAGASAAFPAKKVESQPADLYVIYNGAQYPLYVSVGIEGDQGVYTFLLPKEHAEVTCVGVVRLSHVRYQLIRLDPELVAKHQTKKSGALSIEVTRKGSEYTTGRDVWHRIDSFGDLK
jgi:transcriptional regulator with XRE-family HTH domain